MTADFDVAIVGGGPSGAAAAHLLASRGHSVVVCEKKSFPREKTCGDGLTPRAIKVLTDMGLGRELEGWERVDGLRVHAGKRVMELPWPELDRFPNYGLVRKRKDLDQVVLGHAEAAGAKVLYETHVTEPVFERGVVAGVRAKRDGGTEELRARYTIVAEGAATKFARKLGRERRDDYPMGFAIRQYFDSQPAAHSGWFDAWLDVRDEDDALPAYGWVFPVGDGSINVGVGLLSTFGRFREVNLHRLQDTFIAMLPAEWGVVAQSEGTKPRAGRLFMGNSIGPVHGPGFVLVGDAAGMINPCNGEGIAYGYETGRMAAHHIDAALREGGGPVVEAYAADLHATYGPYYRLGRRFVKVIGNPAIMEFVVALGMQSKRLMGLVMTALANLEDDRAHGFEQKGFKVLKKIAELKP